MPPKLSEEPAFSTFCRVFSRPHAKNAASATVEPTLSFSHSSVSVEGYHSQSLPSSPAVVKSSTAVTGLAAVFPPGHAIENVSERLLCDKVDAIISGDHAAICSYGATGTNKTEVVIRGEKSLFRTFAAQMLRRVGQLWNEDEADDSQVVLRSVTASAVWWYCEQLLDVAHPERKCLPISVPAATTADLFSFNSSSPVVVNSEPQPIIRATPLRAQEDVAKFITLIDSNIMSTVSLSRLSSSTVVDGGGNSSQQQQQRQPMPPGHLVVWLTVKSCSPVNRFSPISGRMVFCDLSGSKPSTALPLTLPPPPPPPSSSSAAAVSGRQQLEAASVNSALVALTQRIADASRTVSTHRFIRLLSPLFSAASTSCPSTSSSSSRSAVPSFSTMFLCSVADDVDRHADNAAVLFFAKTAQALAQTAPPKSLLFLKTSLAAPGRVIPAQDALARVAAAAKAGTILHEGNFLDELDEEIILAEKKDKVKIVVVDLAKCSICACDDATHAFVACGHRAVCAKCSANFKAGDPCPICHHKCVAVIKIFA